MHLITNAVRNNCPYLAWPELLWKGSINVKSVKWYHTFMAIKIKTIMTLSFFQDKTFIHNTWQNICWIIKFVSVGDISWNLISRLLDEIIVISTKLFRGRISLLNNTVFTLTHHTVYVLYQRRLLSYTTHIPDLNSCSSSS